MGAIERGEMIPDTLVGDVLLEALLIKGCQTLECGILVDGFPRTALQVRGAGAKGREWGSGAGGEEPPGRRGARGHGRRVAGRKPGVGGPG